MTLQSAAAHALCSWHPFQAHVDHRQDTSLVKIPPPFLPDLVPKEVLTAWLQYLRHELPTIPFKSSTQQQARNLGQKQLHKDGTTNLKVSEALGAMAPETVSSSGSGLL